MSNLKTMLAVVLEVRKTHPVRASCLQCLCGALDNECSVYDRDKNESAEESAATHFIIYIVQRVDV